MYIFQACSFLLATSDCMSYNLLYDACISLLMIGSKVDKTKTKLTLLVSANYTDKFLVWEIAYVNIDRLLRSRCNKGLNWPKK